MFKTPLHSWSDLPNDVVGLGVCLNPDEKLIATGTSSSSTQAAVKVRPETVRETQHWAVHGCLGVIF